MRVPEYFIEWNGTEWSLRSVHAMHVIDDHRRGKLNKSYEALRS